MKISDKLYKLHFFKNRSIEAVFSHMPYKRVSTGTKNITEAVLFCENFLKNEGILGDKIPLFSEFAKDFYTRRDYDSIYARDKAFGRDKRENWYIDMQRNLDKYLMPRFKDYPIDSIKPLNIETWLIGLQGIGACSKRKILNTLRVILDDAIRKDFIKINPARTIKPPTEKRAQKERRAFSFYELDELFPKDANKRIKIWENLMYATYFSIMYDTGFRPCEISGLFIGNVYSTPQGLAVYTTHTYNTELGRIIERVKTSGKGMESRVGLLSDLTKKLVIMYLDEIKVKDEREPLFLKNRANKNSIFTPRLANKNFKRICKKYNIENVTQYALRHTFTTYRRGNVNENALAIAMGHANGVRDDYDHRTASILIAQLEQERERMFSEEAQDKGIAPLLEKKHG